MPKAAQVAQNHEPELFVPRIWRLLENARLKAARELLAEALHVGSPEPELEQLAELLAPPRQKSSPIKDFDRTTEFRWLAEHGEEYMGQWVAVLGDQLLAHASTLDKLLAQLDRVDRDKPALLHRLS
jgi:hypothetical protein